VQHASTQCRESHLDMRDLQASANPCNARPITRNWSRGKRFESARWLFILPAKPQKTVSDVGVGGFVSRRRAIGGHDCLSAPSIAEGRFTLAPST
jgi:hypothetical protein